MNNEDTKKDLIRQAGQLTAVSALLCFLPAVFMIYYSQIASGFVVPIIITVSLTLFFSAVILLLIAQWRRSERTTDENDQPLNAEQKLENLKACCVSRGRLIDSAILVIMSGISVLLVAVIWIVVIG